MLVLDIGCDHSITRTPLVKPRLAPGKLPTKSLPGTEFGGYSGGIPTGAKPESHDILN